MHHSEDASNLYKQAVSKKLPIVMFFKSQSVGVHSHEEGENRWDLDTRSQLHQQYSFIHSSSVATLLWSGKKGESRIQPRGNIHKHTQAHTYLNYLGAISQKIYL